MTCELTAEPLQAVTRWLASRERMWSARLDALGRHLKEQARTSAHKGPGRKGQ